MDLTDKQVNDLNNMNVAAQNIQLGDVIQDIINNPSSGVNWIDIDTAGS